ncbi:unnamed protein product [Heterobilharzia americana]|nr:unnamed protein product [Heterobilharzia americana]
MTSITETTQTDDNLPKSVKCDKKIQCICKTVDKDVQSEEKPVKTKQTASGTTKSSYFTRILQMETVPDRPEEKKEDSSSDIVYHRSHQVITDTKSVGTDEFLLRSIRLPEESKDADNMGKISKTTTTTIVQLQKSTENKCVDIIPVHYELVQSQTSYDDIHTSETRHVRLQKGTPWSDVRVADVSQDISSALVDSIGSYFPQHHSVAVSARLSHSVSPTASTSRNGNGNGKPTYPHSKPNVVSWGIQFAPVMLTGVTQTTETLKHRTTPDLSVSVGVQADSEYTGEDDYYIKRVVTTIARKGLSSYCRRGPVAKKIVEHTDLLTSSLPSNLDDELDEEVTAGPKATKK